MLTPSTLQNMTELIVVVLTAPYKIYQSLKVYPHQKTPLVDPCDRNEIIVSESLKSKDDRGRKKLLWAAGICTVFVLIELVGGYYAHSLAIMSDAAHMAADLASFLVSLFSKFKNFVSSLLND